MIHVEFSCWDYSNPTSRFVFISEAADTYNGGRRSPLCCADVKLMAKKKSREVGKLSPFLSDADRASVNVQLAGGLRGSVPGRRRNS